MNSFVVAPSVAVVIPVYQPRLTCDEQLAFDRCLSTLCSYPIYIIKPKSLELPWLNAIDRVGEVSFSDEFFASASAYNRLMLCDEFYSRFERYEYILIHQLDALVFRDELTWWCQRGYDYIGAPWLVQKQFRGRLDRMRYRLKSRFAQWVDLVDESGRPHPLQWRFYVGNGGFSLRRVASLRRVLSAKRDILESRYRDGTSHHFHEDIFFGIEANRYRRHLKIPSWREAVRFSIESEPTHALQLAGNRLPFGCHAWSTVYRESWKPILERELGWTL